MTSSFRRVLTRLGGLADLPTDPPDERLRKSTLIFIKGKGMMVTYLLDNDDPGSA